MELKSQKVFCTNLQTLKILNLYLFLKVVYIGDYRLRYRSPPLVESMSKAKVESVNKKVESGKLKVES